MMNMNTGLLSELIIFTAGAMAGSVVTYVLMKRKQDPCEYEEYYEEPDKKESPEEIESEKIIRDTRKEVTTRKEQDMVRYHRIAKDSGYSAKKEVSDVEAPYRIKEEEFGEMDGYATETLYYYADGILTDQFDNIIDDGDELVGDDSVAVFDNDEDCDYIYVRNDVRKTDYEILRNYINFSDKYPTEE